MPGFLRKVEAAASGVAEKRSTESVLAAISGILACAAAGMLMFASYAAFTWGKYQLSDYGTYTNAIWNSGHGHPFKLLVDNTYFASHLSFTIALLGPLFRIWDSPLLLLWAQWALIVAGSLIVLKAALRGALRRDAAFALLLVFIASPFTQSVILASFHGVGLTLFLVPWLYYCLRFRKSMVVLPFVLLLGLREDAGLPMAPILVYFAVKDRWKAGYAYALAGAVYEALALTVLFDWLSPVLFAERRGGLFEAQDIRRALLGIAQHPRLTALFWLFLPAAPLLRRGWKPILVFPSVALLQAVLSSVPHQYALKVQYAAPPMAYLVAGIVEACILRLREEDARMRTRSFLIATWLVAITLVSHCARGLLPGGAGHDRVYASIHPRGEAALAAVRHLPKEGVLLCEPSWAGFCANRSDIVTWREMAAKTYAVDAVFGTTRDMIRHDKHGLRLLESGEFGVRHFDGRFVIMERGYATGRNRAVIEVSIESVPGAGGGG